MNKGTRARLVDGSYSTRIENGEIRGTGNIVSDCVYEVVETGLKLPTMYHGMSNRDHWNDTILKNVRTGELVFVEARFAREIPREVPFLEAVKAYSEGKTIRCELNGMVTQMYKPSANKEFKCITSQLGTAVSAIEVIAGKWYVEEPINE